MNTSFGLEPCHIEKSTRRMSIHQKNQVLCHLQCHIGETGHSRKTLKTGVLSKTAITKHRLEVGHQIFLDHATVVDKFSN